MTAPLPDASARESPPPDASPVRLVAGMVAALTTAVMPVFLLGAVGVFVRRDLELSAFQFGVVLSAFSGGWLLTTVAGGRLADRLGGRRTVALGVAASGAVLLVVAVGVAWWQLVSALAIAGVANALVQPGASTALARGIQTGRLGLAQGTRGINGPAAALLGGLAVPLIAVPFGWRWVFVGGAATVVLYFLVTPSPLRGDPVTGPDGRAPLPRGLWGLVIAAMAGNSAATFLAGFFVEWQTTSGLSESAAGVLFAVGSGAGSMARIGWGVLADRLGSDGRRIAAVLFAAGAAGFVLLSLRPVLALNVLATVVAFGAGWAWLGLLFFAVVRAVPDAPGDATGLLGIGLALGGLIGPGGLGALADAVGLQAAWWAAAALLAVAALATSVFSSLLSSPER